MTETVTHLWSWQGERISPTKGYSHRALCKFKAHNAKCTPKPMALLLPYGLGINSNARIKQFRLHRDVAVPVASWQWHYRHLVTLCAEMPPHTSAPASCKEPLQQFCPSVGPSPLTNPENSYREIAVQLLPYSSPRKRGEHYLQMPSGLYLHHLGFCLDAPISTTARERILLSRSL